MRFAMSQTAIESGEHGRVCWGENRPLPWNASKLSCVRVSGIRIVGQTSQKNNTEGWLALAQSGDESAWDSIIDHSCERLRRLARRMLRNYPALRRWEQTDDILQTAVIRFHRSLRAVKPESSSQFYGLAATQIRRSLLDLTRHHFGPRGTGANHHSDDLRTDDGKPGSTIESHAEIGQEPSTLAEWNEFHQAVGQLPEQEQQIFNLLWYDGMSQPEAASITGIPLRTLKRRWQSARLKLIELMDGETPE